MRPKHYDITRKWIKEISRRNWHNSTKKRRHRQIGRLIYLYCCVRYLTKENGRWVKAMSDGVWLGDLCNTNIDSELK